MNDLPASQGERDSGRELVACFRLAETLDLAVFATRSQAGDARLLRVSEAFLELVGATRAHWLATPLSQLLGGAALVQRGELTSVELVAAAGHKVPVLLGTRRLPGPHECWLWLVFRPEPAHQDAALLARQLVHEVNNPITAVICKLDLVQRQLEGLTTDAERVGEISRHLDEAQRGTARVITLVREFADSLTNADEQTDEVDIGLVLNDVLVLMRTELEQVATVVCDFDSVPLVWGHASKLEQVFSNLLHNAELAIRDTPEPQDHRIRLSAVRQGDWVRVSVEDTGVGMPDSLVRQAFEPFVTTRAASGGTGLGLFICREIVQACGGRLEVKSSPLVGSCFRVYLRVAPGPVSSMSAPSSHRRTKRL